MNYVAQRRKTTGSDKEYSAQPYGGSGEKDPDGHFFEGFAMIPPTSVSQPAQNWQPSNRISDEQVDSHR